MKKFPALLLLMVFTANSFAQDHEIKLYKSILTKGDSLSKVKFDKTTIFKATKNLDKKHPSQYFDQMAIYLSKEKFNEASFLFYLGQMRYRYYNAANPKYQLGNDGALFASLKAVLGEPIDLYIKNDVNNYIEILKLAKNYFAENDYRFFSKKKSEQKYRDQIKNMDDLILSLETDRSTFVEKWIKDRADYKALFKEE
ncbi:hypothetical protein [Chryseobacterium sp. MDT2-18]|uniref:hypothetical protein n=1 Tax=Chryseobacterium sp. MDT2-18 TaxID=1259136 RepID=UPI0027835685|nr:hypothetical protein [Chryseobacterium sp. MDT2-18]MDQ0475676.1 hypothetical protein [Chryseobacterium sp. MDT2-18]